MTGVQTTLQVDVAIIGAGTSGMTAYRAALRAGKRTVLIEGADYGTTCARVGCMPSKLLIAAADAAHSARTAAPFGVHVESLRVDGTQVMERVRRERDRFVSFVLQDIDSMDPADRLRGHARFLSDTCLQVGDHTRVEAKAIVIASGSSPMIAANLSGLGDRLIVNDDVFDWTALPERVLVVGAGVIGLELGQALSRLGVQTCIINRSDGLGGLRDPVVRASAAAALHSELDIRANTEIKSAERRDGKVHLTLQRSPTALSELASTASRPERPDTEIVDYVLVAVGRRPNLDGLGLENTSVVFDGQGRPQMDPNTLQLGSAPIFMAGDVTGRLPVLHEAADEGYIAGANAAGFPEVAAGKRRAPLAIVFTDPQLAQVGIKYNELPASGVVIGRVDFSQQGRARIKLKNYGKLRVYADITSGRFLGAEMAGPEMEHIAHLLAWARQQSLTVQEMLEMPFYHPVIEEGLRTALRDAVRQIKA